MLQSIPVALPRSLQLQEHCSYADSMKIKLLMKACERAAFLFAQLAVAGPVEHDSTSQ